MKKAIDQEKLFLISLGFFSRLFEFSHRFEIVLYADAVMSEKKKSNIKVSFLLLKIKNPSETLSIAQNENTKTNNREDLRVKTGKTPSFPGKLYTY